MAIIALYVKTHRKTGLKYLGKTTGDPFTYRGSGTRWLRHIAKHGYDVDTEVVMWCNDNASIKHWGVYYSDLWNVVKDNKWANLKREEGDGGFEHINNSPKKKEYVIRGGTTIRDKKTKELGKDYGKVWGAEMNALQRERKIGVYSEEYEHPWKKNKELQQRGNSPESRAKASRTARKTFAEIKHQQGEKNSQHGTMWINNNCYNTKWKINDAIPSGWTRGRVVKLPSLPKDEKQKLLSQFIVDK